MYFNERKLRAGAYIVSLKSWRQGDQLNAAADASGLGVESKTPENDADMGDGAKKAAN